MKTSTMMMLAMLLLICAIGPALAAVEKTLPDGKHQITLSIPDMECSMCTRSVSQELKQLAGVTEFKIDDSSRTALVKFDPAQINVKRIQAAIKKAGFASTPVEPAPH